MMKKTFSLLSVLLLGACSLNFDDSALQHNIDQIDERVKALEAVAATRNTDIASLQQAVAALQNQKSVSRTEVIRNGDQEVGHCILFTDGTSINIYHGSSGLNGSAPVFGVEQIGGVYYWTIALNGGAPELIKDGQGNHIPVTGPRGAEGSDVVAPQVRIRNGVWEISIDGGTTWRSTGVKAAGADGTPGAKGDSLFLEVDTSDPMSVLLLLSDGTILRLPRIAQMAFSTSGVLYVNPVNEVAEVNLPGVWRGVDHAFAATLVRTDGTQFTAIHTRVADPVTIEVPPFNAAGEYDGPIRVGIHETAAVGTRALLEFTLIDADAQRHTLTRVVEFQQDATVVGSMAELTAALAAGNPRIVLSADIKTEGEVVFPATLRQLDLGGKVLEAGAFQINDPGDLIIQDGMLDLFPASKYLLQINASGTKLTLNQVELHTFGFCALRIGDGQADVTGVTLKVKNAVIGANTITGIEVYNRGHYVEIENSEIEAQLFGILQDHRAPSGSTYLLTNTRIRSSYFPVYLTSSVEGEPNRLSIVGGTFTSQFGSPVVVAKTFLTVSGATLVSRNAEQSYVQREQGFGDGNGYGIVLAGHTVGVPYDIEACPALISNVKYELSAGASAPGLFRYEGVDVPRTVER